MNTKTLEQQSHKVEMYVHNLKFLIILQCCVIRVWCTECSDQLTIIILDSDRHRTLISNGPSRQRGHFYQEHLILLLFIVINDSKVDADSVSEGLEGYNAIDEDVILCSCECERDRIEQPSCIDLSSRLLLSIQVHTYIRTYVRTYAQAHTHPILYSDRGWRPALSL